MSEVLTTQRVCGTQCCRCRKDRQVACTTPGFEEWAGCRGLPARRPRRTELPVQEPCAHQRDGGVRKASARCPVPQRGLGCGRPTVVNLRWVIEYKVPWPMQSSLPLHDVRHLGSQPIFDSPTDSYSRNNAPHRDSRAGRDTRRAHSPVTVPIPCLAFSRASPASCAGCCVGRLQQQARLDWP